MNLQQKIIKPKLGVLELAKHLGNVSAACKAMGYSRDSYYGTIKGVGKNAYHLLYRSYTSIFCIPDIT